MVSLYLRAALFWHRAGEGRTRLSASREERRQNADTLTRYPTYPFAFSTCARASGGDEKRETIKEEAFTGALLSSDKEKPTLAAVSKDFRRISRLCRKNSAEDASGYEIK